MDFDHQLLRKAYLPPAEARLYDERDKALARCANSQTAVDFRSNLAYLLQVCEASARVGWPRPQPRYLRMYDGIGLPEDGELVQG